MINERIKKLRKQSLETKPSISIERAVLLTNFYKKNRLYFRIKKIRGYL